jgi:hypothetical protein
MNKVAVSALVFMMTLSGFSYAADTSSSTKASTLAMQGADLNQLHGAIDADMDLRESSYIAVYFSSLTGSWGWGRSPDLELAKAIARGYCNENSCEYIFWTRDACAVLATGAGNGYGWAWNTDRLTAVQTALQNCSNFTSSCTILINECAY